MEKSKSQVSLKSTSTTTKEDKKFTREDLEKRRGPLTVGKILRAYRLGNELTQAQLAKKIGVSVQNLSDIENGRQKVSPEKAYKIAKKIGHSEIVMVECALNEQLKSCRMEYTVTLKAA
ncbi:MAG: helix-turn-helix transcriptional regulator [Bdellovibrionota bacterium]